METFLWRSRIPLGVCGAPILIKLESYQRVIRMFDGTNSLADVQAAVIAQTRQLIPMDDLKRVVAQLDSAAILEGPTYQKFLDQYNAAPVRPAAHAGGAYAKEAQELKWQLGQFFEHPKGCGKNEEAVSKAPIKGVLCPHIDFHRGGPVYTWAYQEIVRNCDADVFIVLGVAHRYAKHRFAVSRKDFDTPLGVVKTDKAFVDRLLELVGEKDLEDELAHRTEHSVEFQAVFLQYMLGDKRPFTIVPILAASFHDLMNAGVEPTDDPEVKRFIDALKQTAAECGKKTLYIGGVDFGHVGVEFGDQMLLNPETLDDLRSFDQQMLERATAGDASGWFRTAAQVENRWRICGLSATYTLLSAIGETSGRVLKYDQAVNSELTCCVSFASVAFE